MRSEPPDSSLVWSDDARAELENLRTYLELATGFDLLVIVSDSVLMLDEVRKNVAASSGAIRELIYPNPAAMDHLVVDLLAVGAEYPDGPALVWVEARGETHESRAAWAKGLAVFNQQRNLVARDVPHVVGLVGANELAALIARHAPDLWSIRERVFRFPSPPFSPISDIGTHPSTYETPPASDFEEPEYYFDLADVFAGSNHPDERRARLALLQRAVRSLVARRRFEEAETVLRGQVMPLAESLDDPHSVAVVFDELAYVLSRHGRTPDALEYAKRNVEIMERLATAEPGRADYAIDLVISLVKVSTIHPQSAGRHLHRALDILRGLDAEDRLMPSDRPKLALVESMLAKLDATRD